MAESDDQRRFRRDAATLGEVGRVVSGVRLPEVEVTLPEGLARQALAAWESECEGSAETETFEQRVQRHRAGTLALIGLAIKERGHWKEGEVVVSIQADLIGLALDAADDLRTPASVSRDDAARFGKS